VSEVDVMAQIEIWEEQMLALAGIPDARFALTKVDAEALFAYVKKVDASRKRLLKALKLSEASRLAIMQALEEVQ
jgi:hypothetical protein